MKYLSYLLLSAAALLTLSFGEVSFAQTTNTTTQCFYPNEGGGNGSGVAAGVTRNCDPGDEAKSDRTVTTQTSTNGTTQTTVVTANGTTVSKPKGGPTEYKTLTNIPGITNNGVVAINKNSLGDLLVTIFNYAIGIAIALAVLYVTWGGVEYATAAAAGGKSAGKERIKNAFLGLALTLGSYLILNTINPDLLKFNLNIGALKKVDLKTQQAAMTSGQSAAGGGSKGNWTEDVAKAVIDDNNNKVALFKNLTYNKNFCSMALYNAWLSGGGANCTTFGLLPTGTIDALNALRAACNCGIHLSGGTEWGHVTHGANQASVDIHHSDLDTFIKNKNFPTTSSTCGGTTYLVSAGGYTGRFCNEDTRHWHVMY